MRTTWKVRKVVATEGRTMADLVRVEWFKPNPPYVERMARYDADKEQHGTEEADRRSLEDPDADVFYDEFAEAQPGDEGAEMYEPGGETLTIDIVQAYRRKVAVNEARWGGTDG